ncbi:unnamed protein product [Linum trigynum]|uniref:Uncharacterized protein n=1 Tax=Linum trigynum TaxID=586398 RepID=A0AAV2EQB5_9ROSI
MSELLALKGILRVGCPSSGFVWSNPCPGMPLKVGVSLCLGVACYEQASAPKDIPRAGCPASGWRLEQPMSRDVFESRNLDLPRVGVL